MIRETATRELDRNELSRLFDRYLADGRNSVSSGRIDCRLAERQLDDLERSIGVSVSGGGADVQRCRHRCYQRDGVDPVSCPGRAWHHRPEIRFGIVIPYSGSAKENGQNYKRGIEVAFARVNSAGGVNGRRLKLFAADDGFEPSRTLDAMKQLWDKDQVFGYLGNLGTPTAAVAIPFALDRRALFFAPFTGGSVVRRDPPDRYVFNYRASFIEEGDAAVRYPWIFAS